MDLDMSSVTTILLAALMAFAVCFVMTPPVKTFAQKVGAVDVPKDDRRVHNHPIPRMGGLAIIFGFIVSVLIFVPMSIQILGMLVGTLIIAVMGAVDDIVSLKPVVKLIGQTCASLVAINCGILFNAVTNPISSAELSYVEVGWYSIPLTVLWIVGCTNAVNLIDGLDGLAVGVSAISATTMLIVAAFVSSPVVVIVLSAVIGACLGFIPYNRNPAQIFMGDVGSQSLGFILATTSIMGLFKMQALITFLVPLLALAVPLCDTAFAFIRRMLNGQSPFQADKKHFHHRLLAMGLDQKQAVMTLYTISAVLGLMAVLLADQNVQVKIACAIIAFLMSIGLWMYVFNKNPNIKHHEKHEQENKQ